MREYHYLLAMPEEHALTAVAEHLGKRGMYCHETVSAQLTRTYLDSHDWRLFQQGLELIVEMRGKRRCLRLKERRSGLVLAQVEASQQPDFATALPTGVRWQPLRMALGRRRLSPVLRLLVDEQQLRVDDEQAKCVAVLSVERYELISLEVQGQELSGPQFSLVPIRGYQETLERIRRCLEEQMGWQEHGGDCLLEALSLLGHQPRQGRGYESIELHPDDAMGRSLQRLLAAYLEQLEVNEKGVEADIDEEFLHDFRIALQRTRSLLRNFKGILCGTDFRCLRDELCWLSAECKSIRELDLQANAFRQLIVAEPGDCQRQGEPFLSWLREQRRRQRRRFLSVLQSQQYRDLKQLWHRLANTVGQPWLASKKALSPVHPMLEKITKNNFSRLQKHLQSFSQHGNDLSRRDLRKQVKHLYYLLDAFSTLLPVPCVSKEKERLRCLHDFLVFGQVLDARGKTLGRYQQQLLREAEKNHPLPQVAALTVALMRATQASQKSWLLGLANEVRGMRGKSAQRRFIRDCLKGQQKR